MLLSRMNGKLRIFGQKTRNKRGDKMIDFHVHINKSEKLEYSHTFEEYGMIMDRNNIAKAQVMPNPSSIISVIDNNDNFLESLFRYGKPELFYPFLLFDNKNNKKLLIQLNKFKNHIYGLKYHGSISEMEISNQDLNVFFEFAEKNKLLILSHCGRHHKSHINHLIDVAKRFPNITFIAAHMGGNATDLIEEAIRILEVEKLENIYLDTSACELPRLLEMGVGILGSDKILFGSDQPYKDIRIAKFAIELADITDEDKRKILDENARKLIKDCC